ncbi:MAG: hypothetical protein Q4C06_05630 [Bacillota bacterium]|nr:hypothetical protein [Bacillota bacterium]
MANFITIIMAMLFSGGCSTAHPAEGEQPVFERKEITSFSYYHTGSSTDEIYHYTFTREDGGIHLYAELNCGWRVLDVMVEDAVMEELEEIAYTHQIEGWNGFQETDSMAQDGYSFTLDVLYADGTEVSAHGSNAFPQSYMDAEREWVPLFYSLNEKYEEQIMDVDTSAW